MLIYLQMIESDQDKLKFEKLYSYYRGLMFHVAHGILRNDMDSEDAVHEAFLAVAKNMSKIKYEIDSPKTRAFVVIIVERKAINIYNANKQTNTIELDETFMQPCSFELEQNSAYRAMSHLPAHYRETLYLKYYCGYKPREIAGMLDMSHDAVQKNIQRGKDALRKELEKEDIAL